MTHPLEDFAVQELDRAQGPLMAITGRWLRRGHKLSDIAVELHIRPPGSKYDVEPQPVLRAELVERFRSAGAGDAAAAEMADSPGQVPVLVKFHQLDGAPELLGYFTPQTENHGRGAEGLEGRIPVLDDQLDVLVERLGGNGSAN